MVLHDIEKGKGNIVIEVSIFLILARIDRVLIGKSQSSDSTLNSCERQCKEGGMVPWVHIQIRVLQNGAPTRTPTFGLL